MANALYFVILIGGSVISFLVLRLLLTEASNDTELELQILLKDFHLEEYETYIKESGCKSAVSFIRMVENNYKDDSSHPVSFLRENILRESIQPQVSRIKHYLVFKHWLKKQGLENAVPRFINLGALSLKEVQNIDHFELKRQLSQREFSLWKQASRELPYTEADQYELIKKLWFEIEREREPWTSVGLFVLTLVLALSLGVVVSMSRTSNLVNHYVAPSKRGFLSFVTGRYLSPHKCKVTFDWEDPHVVGSTMSFTVKFVQRNGHPYPICNEDNVLIEVTQDSHKIACSIELGGLQIAEANKAKVQFTVRRAGEYRISILVDMIPIKGSPFVKTFLPGSADPLKTCFVNHCSTVVGSEGIPTQLFIEPRDRYSNHCTIDSDADPSDEYCVDVTEVTSGRPIPDSFHWERYPLVSRLALVLKFPKEGCYRATVSYKGTTIQNGDFHIIILNKEEAYLVQKNVAKKNKCYEVKLLSLNGERSAKPKKVYCYISPKQLTLKEFMWKFFPKHLITFRLCPSTKIFTKCIPIPGPYHKSRTHSRHTFKFQSKKNDLQGEPVLVIDDGCQQEVELISPERNIIAATFTQFLLKNIGGSETFKDKQDFFYHEVRKYHQKHFHDKLVLKIARENLLESSFKETKSFGVSDWCKNFEITFIGEEGLDWGGLRREWFELVCVALFDAQNQFFDTFKSDKQGLVHPCPSFRRAAHVKLKYYEFAGKMVGKCLYESALGSSYRQLVKAKFSRSFLAQLIGLSVHYKYFEHDDPDLFVSKIKYILDNDIESMGLYFTEEVYDASGQLMEEVELITNGSSIPVTNDNKIQYLNALAQYRLSSSVKPEIEHFLKGLNELIPDNLLCIFDENELELLMCGTGSYSISDFKANHAVSGSSYEFRKVLEWFWIAVSNFAEEEMARLLQFTTGCSQLPPGGFSELNPKFHITAAPTFGNLPTAHTCFNQLCLPDYDSYEQFERALRLAINEGSEGFGMV